MASAGFPPRSSRGRTRQDRGFESHLPNFLLVACRMASPYLPPAGRNRCPEGGNILRIFDDCSPPGFGIRVTGYRHETKMAFPVKRDLPLRANQSFTRTARGAKRAQKSAAVLKKC